MDFLKGKSSGNETQERHGGGGGLMDKANNSLGGGQKGEQNEDALDKGVDFAQERMGQGQQNDESAVEQAKDEQISDGIRRGFKGATGKDVPIQDK
ncbi:hypothetical protein EV714DRAFT_268526 [Schizophyllum commune]